jgi:CheY-like chemotaxis protein
MRPYILIVEDDGDISEVTSEILESEGYEVAVVPDGLAGLHSIARRPPDLIIADLMMPMMTGVEMLGHLRRWSKVKQLPTIVMTAMPEMIRDELDASRTVVLVKPVRHGALLEAVQKLLGRAVK